MNQPLAIDATRTEAGPPSLPPVSSAQLMAELLTAFEGSVPAVRRNLAYRLTVGVAAMWMLLLPVGYLGLIVALGCGLWRAWQFLRPLIEGSVWLAAGSSVVFVVSAVLVLIALKPLLARPSARDRHREVQLAEQPLLFAFVQRLCRAVDAPEPVAIRVSLAANSAAELREGLTGLFGNRYVLTIGLPFAAGMDLKSFAGILSHELGHFRQGTGMRLNHVIQAVDRWFDRLVFRDDVWDERLETFLKSGHLAVLLVGHVLTGLVWIVRRSLWVLMMLGRLTNGWLLRQMELDADRCAVRVAGSDVFGPTTRRAIELSVAHSLAHELLLERWQRRGVPVNLPAFTSRLADRLPEESSRLVDGLLNRRRTRLFDTHPAPRRRVVLAERETAAGVFHWDGPATWLFTDFDRLAAELTYEAYQAAFGPLMSRDQLLPVETFWRQEEFERR